MHSSTIKIIYVMQKNVDCLCGLVARVPGYRSRGTGSMSTIEEILGRKSSGSGLES
jgi:hypothetical protein